MAHIPRHDDILKLISRLRSVSVGELTERLGVSEVTIRKDLTFLEEQGIVVRTHGGAKLAEEVTKIRNIHLRRGEHRTEKERAALKARELVNDDDTIFIDTGTTCTLLAQSIREMSLRVVTNSLEVMDLLAQAPGISLISIGGSFRRESGSFIGPIAVETLQGLQIETCFLGTTGFTSSGVFSSQNSIEAELKKQVLSISRRRVVIADRTKYEKEAFAVFARSGEVDILVVDEWFPGADRMKESGIEVLAAERGNDR